jgi:hypothetical protein
MTSPIAAQYRTKSVHEITAPAVRRQLRLSDRIVELGEQEFDWYQKVAAWLPSVRDLALPSFHWIERSRPVRGRAMRRPRRGEAPSAALSLTNCGLLRGPLGQLRETT